MCFGHQLLPVHLQGQTHHVLCVCQGLGLGVGGSRIPCTLGSRFPLCFQEGLLIPQPLLRLFGPWIRGWPRDLDFPFCHFVPEVCREWQARQPCPAENDVSKLLILVLACPSLDRFLEACAVQPLGSMAPALGVGHGAVQGVGARRQDHWPVGLPGPCLQDGSPRLQDEVEADGCARLDDDEDSLALGPQGLGGCLPPFRGGELTEHVGGCHEVCLFDPCLV
mmetsp:Transcript_110185/g.190844  ORF Transcript_110185/g.190844 Transcript_110185/m.190844 type:complete len:222 (-) Transcript_110185:863-1528(-)